MGKSVYVILYKQIELLYKPEDKQLNAQSLILTSFQHPQRYYQQDNYLWYLIGRGYPLYIDCLKTILYISNGVGFQSLGVLNRGITHSLERIINNPIPVVVYNYFNGFKNGLI